MQININDIPKDVIGLISIIKEEGQSAYIVGGCVHDMVMKREPHDFDICTSAKPDETIHILEKHDYKYHTTGIQFGTVVALVPNKQTNTESTDNESYTEYEITTYRKETDYLDSRHPSSVSFECSLEEDLKRRDFTMNALAYDPTTGEFIDKFGGLYDIAAHTINAIGNAEDRFNEDGLRILRALRFAVTFEFTIGEATELSMKQSLSRLDTISNERVTSEFKKMLTSGKPIKQLFSKYDWLITYIIPELAPCVKFDQMSKYHKHDIYEHILHVVDGCETNKFEIKMAALLHDIGKPSVCIMGDDGHRHFIGHEKVSHEMSVDLLKRRFCLTSDSYNEILTLVRYHDMSVSGTRKSVKRALNKLGVDVFKDWVVLKSSDQRDHINISVEKQGINDKQTMEKLMQEIIAEQQCFKVNDLAVNGKDIMDVLKIRPGKVVGIILNILLDKVIDEEIENEREALLNEIVDVYNSIESGKGEV